MHISTSTRARSSVSDYLRLFSRDTWTMVEKVWSQFMGHCRVHSQGMYAYYLMHGLMRLVQRPMAYGAGSHSSHKGPWMYARLLWSGRYKWAMSFSAILLTRYFIGSNVKNFFETSKSLFILIYSASIYSFIQPWYINPLWYIYSLI